MKSVSRKNLKSNRFPDNSDASKLEKYQELKSLYSSSIISGDMSDKMSAKRLEVKKVLDSSLSRKSKKALHERILKRYQKMANQAKKKQERNSNSNSKTRKQPKLKYTINRSAF